MLPAPSSCALRIRVTSPGARVRPALRVRLAQPALRDRLAPRVRPDRLDLLAVRNMAVKAVAMRVEQRGDKWVVLPESGDKVLGTHDTKEEALRQLRAIEASKARAMAFEASRGPDGKVRSHVWDYV